MDTPSDLEHQLAWERTCRGALRALTRATAADLPPADTLAVLSEVIGRALGVDRSMIYDVDFERQEVTGLTEWLNPGTPGVTSTLAVYPLEAFGAAARWLRENRRHIESHVDAPAEVLRADGSAAVLHGPMSSKSLLWYPVTFHERGFILLTFHQVSRIRRWTAAEIELVADASQLVAVALQKFRVIDERSHALADARRNMANLGALVRSIPVGVLFETDDRRVLVANSALCQILALHDPPDAMVDRDSAATGRALAGTLADPEGFLRRTEEIVAARRPVAAEALVLREGRVLERDYVHVGEPSTDGAHLWLFRDVTSQRRDQQRLRQLERAIEQSPVGVVITDLSGTIVYVNRRFTEISGRTPEDVVGKNPRVMKSPDTERRLYQEMWATITAGREWTGELTNLDRNGEPYPVRVSISPVLDEQGRVTHYVALQEDLREQRRSVAALREADERLRLAQKMEAVSRFAGGVAHDFNNMLTVIDSYTSMAIEDLSPSDPMSADLAQVKAAAERATDLARRLLAFSRHDSGEPRSVNVDEFIRSLHRVLRRLVDEDIQLVVETEAEGAVVWVDPSQLEQALLNLASNARDAMPRGGTLTLSTSIEAARPGPAGAPPGGPTGESVVLRVADTGEGMSTATRARIFEPFFTTKDVGRGTGLGLSLVYSFVQQSGGAVAVESQRAKGSTFTVTLPRHAAPEAVRAGPAMAARRDARGNEVVLIVDDEVDVLNVARRILSRAGYTVVTAANGGEALLWCERSGAEAALLLCDVVMPSVRGPELVRRLAPLCPRARVLFMTGYMDRTKDVLPPGAEVIAKPFDVSTLLGRVRATLDRPT